MFRATPDTTLVAYLERFYHPARNLAAESLTQYQIQLGNLQKYVDELRAEEVAARRTRGLPVDEPADRPLTLADLCDELVAGAMQWQVNRGRTADTANKILTHILPMWNMAVEQEILSKRCKVRRYRVLKKAPIALLPDELERIIAAAGMRDGFVGEMPAGLWWTAIVLLIFSTGGRIGAIFRCRTEKLDLDRGEISLLAHTQKQRGEQQLDLLPGVVSWLRELQLAERKVERVLGDWPWKVRALRDDYTRLFVEAGIYQRVDQVPRTLKFHALRKTLASQIFTEGGITAACERLGHSSVKVTEAYIDPRYKKKVRIQDLVKDPSPARLPRPTLKIHRDAV